MDIELPGPFTNERGEDLFVEMILMHQGFYDSHAIAWAHVPVIP